MKYTPTKKQNSKIHGRKVYKQPLIDKVMGKSATKFIYDFSTEIL